MEICESLVCPCYGKLYKTKATLKAHRSSLTHKNWELPKEKKTLEVDVTRLQNENEHLRRLNILLIERIQQLEKNNIKV